MSAALSLDPNERGQPRRWEIEQPSLWEHCFPINPKRTNILGIKAYPALTALPVSIDIAVIVTPVSIVSGLVVQGKGVEVRRLTLGNDGLRHLLTYLDDHRLKVSAGGEAGGERSDYLFLSEAGQPLTKSGMVLVFDRLRKRAGLTGKPITAALLRRCFATRYL